MRFPSPISYFRRRRLIRVRYAEAIRRIDQQNMKMVGSTEDRDKRFSKRYLLADESPIPRGEGNLWMVLTVAGSSALFFCGSLTEKHKKKMYETKILDNEVTLSLEPDQDNDKNTSVTYSK